MVKAGPVAQQKMVKQKAKAIADEQKQKQKQKTVKENAKRVAQG